MTYLLLVYLQVFYIPIITNKKSKINILVFVYSIFIFKSVAISIYIIFVIKNVKKTKNRVDKKVFATDISATREFIDGITIIAIFTF